MKDCTEENINKGIVALITIVIAAILWPYIVNTWLVVCGKPPQLFWYHGALLGIIPWFNDRMCKFAIFTWIAMMFIR